MCFQPSSTSTSLRERSPKALRKTLRQSYTVQLEEVAVAVFVFEGKQSVNGQLAVSRLDPFNQKYLGKKDYLTKIRQECH